MSFCLKQLNFWKRLQTAAGNFLLVAAVGMLATTGSPSVSAQDFSGAEQGKPSPVSQDALKNAMKILSQIDDTEETNAMTMSAMAKSGAKDKVSGDIDNAFTNSMEALDDHYRLKIGDSVNFQVIEDEDDPKPLIVTDSGDLEIPYVGRYPAAGKSCKQLAKQLKTELEKKYYFQATVILSVNSKTTQGIIYLVGGVKAPGPLEIPRDDVLTVSKAILRAGGFDDFADQKHVRVTRRTEGGTNEVFTVNVSAILDKGQTAKDAPAEPGDLIYVPEKSINF